MKEHDLKCWPLPFENLISGAKRFELRRDDRGFAVGDWLVLREWDPSKRPPTIVGAGPQPNGYTGRALRCRVTYLCDVRDWVSLDRSASDRFIVMSLELPCPDCDGHGENMVNGRACRCDTCQVMS